MTSTMADSFNSKKKRKKKLSFKNKTNTMAKANNKKVLKNQREEEG